MDTTEILKTFGLTPAQVEVVSIVVLLTVEALKRCFPKDLVGWKTLVASFVIAFGLSATLLLPDWSGIISLTILAVVLPAGAKSLIKKVGNGTGSTR